MIHKGNSYCEDLGGERSSSETLAAVYGVAGLAWCSINVVQEGRLTGGNMLALAYGVGCIAVSGISKFIHRSQASSTEFQG